MSETWTRLAPCRFGVLFALLTLLFGFGLGAAFGAKEDALKGHLKEEAQAVLATTYGGDAAKAKKVTDKSWVYFKRAHLHANGLGTAALALILLLSILAAGDRTKSLTALASGLGGLGYSIYWLLAGLRAPGMGSTGAAKDSLDWLAIPSSGLCIVGLVAVIVLLLKTMAGARAAR
ncbi:MAG: hypothetical protein OER88_11430 [Planctomycetota bacterium]|nr:hypothetical protein [Planctomycetota bacterium]